ncbi:MAG: SRPBCC family protein, partial [Verrucomicrobiota bacterium]
MAVFSKSVELPVRAGEAFAWHEREGAFERLNPPWKRVRVREHSGGIRDGARVWLELRQGPFKIDWRLRHSDYQQGRLFCDVQESGPFRSYRHAHRFEPIEPGRCRLEEAIEFELPRGLGWLEPLVRRDFQRVFAYRHRVTHADLTRWSARQRKGRRVLITGATGLVGSALAAYLETQGDTVIRQSRHSIEGGLQWDPMDAAPPDLAPF